MSLPTDCRPVAVELYFLPVELRTPLKFGSEVTTSLVCARARMTVEDRQGRRASGWGETPLNPPWPWPSELPYSERCVRMRSVCARIAAAWLRCPLAGHPLEVGHDFEQRLLPEVVAKEQAGHSEPIPYLGSLVCASPFDIALHDAYGNLHGIDIYDTYNPQWMSRSLGDFLTSDDDRFQGIYPEQFLDRPGPTKLLAWHLVGGLDPLIDADRSPQDPRDEYPVTLAEWIRRDGLQCLKVKLRGTDAAWDYERLVGVGRIALAEQVATLSADFNCMVDEPEYVCEVLDHLAADEPAIYERLLYVEQPFPYDLAAHRIDVRSVSCRKPLFLDESASDWQSIRLGRQLGWNGVALKTCKTQTTAILSLCWAKAHGMPLMVQDLTNPMLAQIPHVRLAAHAGTIRGVETNAMQFYPDASLPEAAVHPGLYRRRAGCVDLSTIGSSGFGLRVDEIKRVLPEPALVMEI